MTYFRELEKSNIFANDRAQDLPGPAIDKHRRALHEFYRQSVY